MGDVLAADPSSLIEEWKTAFFAIHKKNPRKADWLRKAPAAVKQAYMSKNGIDPAEINASTTSKKANSTQCIRLKRPATDELDFPVKRVKLQQQSSLALSDTATTTDNSNFCHSQNVLVEVNAAAEAAEVETPVQSLNTAEEMATDSPTKAALAPFCGLRPVLRRSPRKLPSFLAGFESPQKLAFVVQRNRQSVSRRNICQLIDSAHSNGQDDNDSQSPDSEEPDENVPFEGSEPVADAVNPKKPRAKRAAIKSNDNFVRLNMRKKTFVRGHTSATTKRKFWNRRRFMNNRK